MPIFAQPSRELGLHLWGGELKVGNQPVVEGLKLSKRDGQLIPHREEIL
jgi:hypothetical protein